MPSRFTLVKITIVAQIGLDFVISRRLYLIDQSRNLPSHHIKNNQFDINRLIERIRNFRGRIEWIGIILKK